MSSSTKPNTTAVSSTADDAIIAKLSTVNLGYYSDPFLQHFATNASGVSASSSSSSSKSLKRYHDRQQQQQYSSVPPIIRKGTHARVCCIDRAIKSFLELDIPIVNDNLTLKNEKKQVVVLGSGKDTTYLRLCAGLMHGLKEEKEEEMGPAQVPKWWEIDHPSVIRSKAKLLSSFPIVESDVFGCLSSISVTPSSSLCSNPDSSFVVKVGRRRKTLEEEEDCRLVGYDLTSSPKELLDGLVDKHGFSLERPTLFVMECVQMYLPDDASNNLLSTITQCCTHPLLALYDPILLLSDDPFGATMKRNLIRANVISSSSNNSLIQNPTLSHHLQKMIMCGFDVAVGCDMMDAYGAILTMEERKNASRCEMLDELEEWVLIMKHYCFVLAEVLPVKRLGRREQQQEEGDDDAKGMRYNGICAVGKDSIIGFVEGKCSVRRKQ